MHKLYGTVPTADGRFVQVKISEVNGKWKVDSVYKRDTLSVFHNELMMNKKMLLGIESSWIRDKVPDFLSLNTAKTETGDFHACTQSANYSYYCGLIEKNLCGVYPDDAYLGTVPVHYVNRISHSYITVSAEDVIYKIGIVCQMRLMAVFSVVLPDLRKLSGHLSRIRRYWGNISGECQFPGTVVLLNMPEMSIDGIPEVRSLTLYKDDIDVLKAIGVALCGITDCVPAYSGITGAARFRKIRSTVILSSAIIVIATLLALGVSAYGSFYYQKKYESGKNEYNAIIEENRDIRLLLSEGATLSARLSQLDSVGARKSSWSKMLYLIGKEKPQGLYIARLGSDKIDKRQNGNYRIALAGWAMNDTSVTEMLRKLNSSDIIENASLQNMQQDSKKKNIYTFKILCQLKSEK